MPASSALEIRGRFDRWKFQFDAKSADESGLLFEHFEIDLGVIGGNRPGIDYLVGLTAPRPTSRIAHPSQERRLYLILNQAQPMTRWVQTLADRAGVPTAGRNLLLLINARLENHLANLERRYCEDHGSLKLEQIQSVRFRLGVSEGIFSLQIAEVTLRDEVAK